MWNPIRQVFVAAIQFHGYYQSVDGVSWTRMTAQPGSNLAWSSSNCPTEPGLQGVAGCPIFRGSLAVNPLTGDTFAWTVDDFLQDQGIWQDACGLTGTVTSPACTSSTINFGTQLPTTALEISDENGPATIPDGDYNLALAAVPAGLGTAQDTLLFAGSNDLWKCSLANSCAWRNTTNAFTCMSAQVSPYQHAVAWDQGNPLLMYLGNDGGLWRSTDLVAEAGDVCAAADATHYQNLNGSLGSLTEVESLAQSGATAATMFTGLGVNGFAGIVNNPTTAADWGEVLGGEGGTVAIDTSSHLNSWYANNDAGVAISHCISSGLCTASGFAPVIGETQVQNDGLSMFAPAPFLVDSEDPSQLLIGTCRVWRGSSAGTGWTSANAISPILDGTGIGNADAPCEGRAQIITIAALSLPGGAEALYVGMAGAEDGGGVVAGHVFSAILSTAGTTGTWTDLALNPVVNNVLGFNAFGEDLSALYIDPHDATGSTVYATVSGFSSSAEPLQQIYQTTDAGAHWTAIAANLPNAPANAVIVDPQDANTVYVGLDTGVYATRAIATCGSASCWRPMDPTCPSLQSPRWPLPR